VKKEEMKKEKPLYAGSLNFSINHDFNGDLF
jgi:hypothetical protein